MTLMRKKIIITLFVFLMLILLVLGVSYFIQPRLAQEPNRVLYLSFASLVGVSTFLGFIFGLVGFIAFLRARNERKTVLINEQQNLRNRKNMLQLVWNTWIDGVLKQSLYKEVLELEMKTKPDAVEHPWDMVMEMPDQTPKTVTPGTSMLKLLDHSNGSLLILGEPGSGKTTILLELARLAIGRAEVDPIEPIPVVFNLSSWTPKLALADWLVNELRDKYYVSTKIGRQWIETDELLLLLDGLDEVKVESREACVQSINTFRADHNMNSGNLLPQARI